MVAFSPTPEPLGVAEARALFGEAAAEVDRHLGGWKHPELKRMSRFGCRAVAVQYALHRRMGMSHREAKRLARAHYFDDVVHNDGEVLHEAPVTESIWISLGLQILLWLLKRWWERRQRRQSHGA